MTDDIVERINGEIHVWWSYLDQPAEVTDKCYEILSEPQRARISRYKTVQLRNRQTVSDGSLTSPVGGYLNEDPGHIELQFAKFGKPFLVRSAGGINLQFSVSHSSQIGVYAFARDRLIGVDVEEMVPRADWEGVLAMYLSEYERVWFSRLASPRKPEMSYRLWTIKEAYLKAVRIGLSISPADIEVSLEGENEYRFHSINGESERGWNWKLSRFTPATIFSASVVVEAGPTRIRYFHWEPRRLLNSHLP
jgi:4'-phosphopantetheinyl transferase